MNKTVTYTHAQYCPHCGNELFCDCKKSRRHQSGYCRRCATSPIPPEPARALAVVLEVSEKLKEAAILDGRYEDAAVIRDCRLWMMKLNARNQQKGQRKC